MVDKTLRYPYCIQCKDEDSGKTGDFAYDPTKGNTVGNFHAITPVFDDLSEFYKWIHNQDEIHIHHGRSLYCTPYR